MRVYLDETGVEDNACRERGWSEKGKRCYDERAFRQTKRANILAALCGKNLIAPFVLDGTCDTKVFEYYVGNILVPELKTGQFVIMDNINFHYSEKVAKLIEKAGCTILFLPKYSPDKNPIERKWFVLKNEIRKIAKDFKDIFDATIYVLKKVTI